MYKVRLEIFEESHVIFKLGDKIEKMYVLADGVVNSYMSVNDEDLVLDTLEVPGCVLGQYSLLRKAGMSYSARAVQATTLLTI